MEYPWILAWTENNQAPSRVGDQPLNGPEQTTTTTTVPDQPPEPGERDGSQFPIQIVFIGFMLLIVYMFMLRGPRKQQQKHRQMVQALSKNDRVRTIGGILGTVVDIKGDEVTLKIDESTNTKIKITTSAIGRNLTQEGKD